tara:strand:+ start:350 stop:508 length:159 start_codon:yes stop_codon:yes gene_type:complete
MGKTKDKVFDIFGTGKEKTKDIAKKSGEIIKVGLAIGIAGVGLGYGLSALKS